MPTFLDRAEELISKFPDIDRSKLLLRVTGSYLMDLKFGNKREERAACDFLNLLQSEAVKLLPPQYVVRNDQRVAPPGSGQPDTQKGN